MVLLRQRGGRTCPVCGAEDMACTGAPAPKVAVIRDTDYTVLPDGRVIMDARYRYRLTEGRWTSLRDVLVQIGEKKFERRYAAGDFIPLLEALAQNQVGRSQLTEVDKVDLKRHLVDGLITLDQLREALVVGGA